jgi:two-component system response regulator RegX3
VPGPVQRKVKDWQRVGSPAAGEGHAVRMRLLVVEDDDAIAAPLVQALQRAGHEVDRVATGAEALVRVAAADLVLLDLGLPDMDGSEVCRHIRAVSTVPIIVVSARGDEGDRVHVLDLGADDYIVKPFGTRELLARVRAVSRRAPSEADAPTVQRLGVLEIDRRTRRVTVADRDVALSPKEFDLLSLLGEDPGAVVGRQQIMDEVWDPHWYGPTKTLDVHVASLRKKLGDPTLIETVRSVGFRLRDQ